ncbi:unnamed protein product [Cylicocyclus nassatus]|uniref:Uncharacterized protein n=1 Tax=Cylicocyclus nassatus TaxID=53992 RepID=A0AA36DPA9_CYLNA|nr:unnamed protein product [Cylicocyclus nassatus]
MEENANSIAADRDYDHNEDYKEISLLGYSPAKASQLPMDAVNELVTLSTNLEILKQVDNNTDVDLGCGKHASNGVINIVCFLY